MNVKHPLLPVQTTMDSPNGPEGKEGDAANATSGDERADEFNLRVAAALQQQQQWQQQRSDLSASLAARTAAAAAASASPPLGALAAMNQENPTATSLATAATNLEQLLAQQQASRVEGLTTNAAGARQAFSGAGSDLGQHLSGADLDSQQRQLLSILSASPASGAGAFSDDALRTSLLAARQHQQQLSANLALLGLMPRQRQQGVGATTSDAYRQALLAQQAGSLILPGTSVLPSMHGSLLGAAGYPITTAASLSNPLAQQQRLSSVPWNFGASAVGLGGGTGQLDPALLSSLASSGHLAAAQQPGVAAPVTTSVAAAAPAPAQEDSRSLDQSGAAAANESSGKTIFKPKSQKRPYRHVSFPEKLYKLLNDAEKNGKTDIVSWINDGTAFQVHQPEKFETEILEKYFRHKKLSSFQRQLGLYGFIRIKEGKGRGGHEHERFKKAWPDRLKEIQRIDY
mmetsp:Transcript_7471/g.15223  ORF Transcript_7471/g.15223 Transcript_7471/m.15223 type:complete len:458 (+) Transcript_7471:89-1462(+)